MGHIWQYFNVRVRVAVVALLPRDERRPEYGLHRNVYPGMHGRYAGRGGDNVSTADSG